MRLTTKKAFISKIAMEKEYIVETIHEETIKPSSPTPPTLNTFNLSLIDQICSPPMYVPLIFWYPNNNDRTDHDFTKVAKERSQRLKKSLSKTLAHFYHFAGRMSSNFIRCNDEGVHYIEARVNCLLQEILKKPNSELPSKLLPISFDSGESTTGRVLLVKVNFFECSGMAIGVCISHKIADLSTLATFIKSWAAIAREEEVVLPELVSFSSLFPPMDLPTVTIETEFKGEKVPRKRFVFDASKISMIKAKASSSAVPEPTRIEAVTALIWKCAMAAATSNRGGLTHRPSAMSHTVNLRKRMNPPLPENSVGNLVSGFIALTPDSETELQGLVQQLRNGIREFSENSVRKLQGSLAISAILENVKAYSELSGRDEVDLYTCTSWCRFDLYGGANFGWGRPGWVSQGVTTSLPKYIALMDSSDGEGIEAWICLNEDEMTFFECNEELLQFASVNPSVV